jgi:deoxyribonuclease V
MRDQIEHDWEVTPKEAVQVQKHLAARVVPHFSPRAVKTVAGIDTSYRKGMARAAVVVLTYPELQVVEEVVAERKVDFPYVPGLLSFREGPAVMDAFGRLSRGPDLLIFDGQGLAHPRRFGIASHIGVLVGLPSIGCAKSRLIGEYEEPGNEKGSVSLLVHKGETVGAVVRTRSGVKPVFVSVGHLIDLKESIRMVLQCCRRYRLPQTTRMADKLAGEWGRGQPP